MSGKFFWKVDYYNNTLAYGSDAPWDAKQTTRVLTIMLALIAPVRRSALNQARITMGIRSLTRDLFRNRVGRLRVRAERMTRWPSSISRCCASASAGWTTGATPEQIALWREDVAKASANLAIEDMTPIIDEDAMFALMLDEGVPPAVMPLIIISFYQPKTR